MGEKKGNTRSYAKPVDEALLQALLALAAILMLAIDQWPAGEPFGPYLRKALLKKQKEIAGLLAGLGGAAGAGGAIAAWQASLGFWGGVGAWLGLVTMPAWVPVAGVLGGVATAALVTAGVVKKVRGSEAPRNAKLRAAVTSVMALGTLEAAVAERVLQALRDALAGTGVSKADLEGMLGVNRPRAPDDIELNPDDYTTEERGTALQDAWLIVIGVAEQDPAAVRLHDRLCSRMGLGDHGAQIREAAKSQANLKSKKVGAMADSIEVLAGPEAPHLEEFLEPILMMDPYSIAKQRRRQVAKGGLSIGAVGASVAALALGRPELVGFFAGAYGTARAVVEADDQQRPALLQELADRATQLATKLGIGATEQDQIIDAVDREVGAVAARERKSQKKVQGSIG